MLHLKHHVVRRSSASGFLRSALTYGLGTTLYKFHVVLLLPLFARFLPRSENGALEVALFASGLLGALVGFNLPFVASHRYVAAEESARRRVIGESMIVMSVLAAAAVVLCPLLAWTSAPLLDELRDRLALVVAAFIGATFNSYIGNTAVLCQLRGDRRGFNVLYLTWAAAILVVTAGGLVVFELGASSYLLAMCVAGVLCTIASVVLLWSDVVLAVRHDGWRRATVLQTGSYLRSGLPLLPIAVLNWLLLFADRRLLLAGRDLAEVGTYGFAVRLAAAVTVLLQPVSTAWWEAGMNRVGDQLCAAIRHSLDLMFAVCLAGAAVLSVAALSPLAELLGSYSSSAGLVPMLSISSVMLAVFAVPNGLLVRRGRFGPVTIAYGAAVVTNISINLLLNRSLGAAGASIANVISYATMVVVAAAFTFDELREALRSRWGWYALAFVSSVALGSVALVP